MNITKCVKESFSVIGREGSTNMGEGFVQKLWAEANANFGEVAALAKKNEDGGFAGFWGAMSDMSRAFMPWSDGFTKGLYLAGVECKDDTEAPAGWVKWTVPAYEYIKVLCDGGNIFAETLAYLEREGLSLAGAVHDFTDPASGLNYMFFPIRKL